MRILVTGGAGFIGSHVVDGYLDAGHEVIVVDNLSTGRREHVDRFARLFEVDIRDATALQRIVADFRPDVINHHAAQCRVPVSVQHPSFDASVNIVGGLNVLSAAVRSDVRKLIFSSTGGAVYGNPTRLPCRETHPLRPLSPYGVAKLSFEAYLAMYRRTYGLDYTVLRYANVYGPRQGFEGQGGRVIANFATQMLLNQSVTIDGVGEQARDMIFVSDVVSANIKSLGARPGRTYNIGTGKATTVNQVFAALRPLTGYERAPVLRPARKGDVYRIVLDYSRARRDLGWEPRVSLEAGLQATVEYLREHAIPMLASTHSSGPPHPVQERHAQDGIPPAH